MNHPRKLQKLKKMKTFGRGDILQMNSKGPTQMVVGSSQLQWDSVLPTCIV